MELYRLISHFCYRFALLGDKLFNTRSRKCNFWDQAWEGISTLPFSEFSTWKSDFKNKSKVWRRKSPFLSFAGLIWSRAKSSNNSLIHCRFEQRQAGPPEMKQKLFPTTNQVVLKKQWSPYSSLGSSMLTMRVQTGAISSRSQAKVMFKIGPLRTGKLSAEKEGEALVLPFASRLTNACTHSS